MGWGLDSIDPDDPRYDDVDPDAMRDRRDDEQWAAEVRDAEDRAVRMRHIGGEVLDEVERSIVKNGLQEHVALGNGSHTIPLVPIDPAAGGAIARRLAERAKAATDAAAERGDVTWVAILLEEVFEAVAADDAFDLRGELVQIAAVAVKMVDRVDADRERLAHLAAEDDREVHR